MANLLDYLSKKATGSLKVRIERLDATQWHSSFAEQAGKEFFDRILKEKNIYMINDEVGRLTLLSTTTLDPEYILEFMAVGWGKLKELVDKDIVVANTVTPCQVAVTVRGGLKNPHHPRKLVDEARSTFLDPDDTGVKFCSLCTDVTSNPEKLGCWHSHCPCCISLYTRLWQQTGAL
ncbi:hypothetical protein BDN70DRAFT_988793 [Pholiota conissans]|uniref:Uncharacterized protein n=1 Tax=Pholiota conissans TaxID=109636 RepID=A0A9P5ZFA0_9AGAR|nr:hypothetical protein BDN70DRAFT_988793 [Pholiota conissans]